MRATFFRRGLPRTYALAVVVLAGGMSAAEAQQKRLGLVVGISDYGTTNHPTALQDAGLVSQSLKGAGFEVTEAANLSQDEFRTTFRDFTQKAASAGPDSIITVYIAGVSLQDDGENILIPAGANLRQRTDLALEGLRLNDFIRALGVTPAQARLVMFDTAYAHPYGQLVAEGSRGLALGEAVPGMVIAYNAAPGLAAPLPQSNYGAYAMALAETLREPGLNLNAMFERVRLRVNDLSAGAQTPWHAASVPPNIVLNAPKAGTALIETLAPDAGKPLAELSGDEAYARALAQDTIKGYEAFLAAYPTHAQAKRVRAQLAARREAVTWQRARKQNTDRAYWTYMKRYPKGSHVAEAERRLTRLSAPIEPPPRFDEVIFEDAPPPPAEELVVFDSVVADDGWAALPPPPPPEVYPAYLLPPPPVEIIDLPPPRHVEPWERALPAVAIGAGVVGAALLANRIWKRPQSVRPVVAPPVVRPPRPTGGWVNRPPVVLPPRPPVVRPPVAQPPVGRPPVVGGPPPVTPPVARPPVGQPPVVGAQPGARPGGLPQPGAIQQGGRPGVLPQPQPGAIGRPATQPPAVPPVATPSPASGPKPVLQNAPPPPPGARGVLQRTTPPPAARPPAVQNPPANVQRPGPMIGRPMMTRPTPPPQVQRRPPPQAQRPVIPQRPPVVRQAPAARPMPMQRPAPVARPQPVYRPPPPAARPAPVYRPPAPVARPAAPAYRPPPPAARPAAPAPRPCSPQMRAARQC
jgi:uncharacterized caspase-like protein